MTAALVPVGLVVLVAVLAMCALAAWNLRLFRVAPPPLADPPSLSILMPARNEVDQIEGAVRAACADLPPGREVVVLDDGSTDGTGAVLARLARKLPGLRVVTGAPLPPGWAGKAWACWQLASEHARGEWLLFVDCDVRLARHAPARLLAAARAESVAFASAFPRQHVLTVGEALLVPLVHLVLLAYLPMALLRRVPRASLSAGCGQLMLARREVYLAADGHRAIRATLHDGIQLARRMKAAGHAIAVLDGRDLATCRMYVGLSGAWRGFARNAYEALGSPAALAVMCLLNAGLFIAPWLGLGAALATTGWSEAAAVWALAVAAVVALRARLARRFGAPLWTALATPVAVTLMIALQIHSYFTHCTGRPVVWRARAYPGAAPVRKGRA